jgi:mutator protein MutT
MTTSIAIAVVEHADQFLIGQRPAGAALAQLWEFPGGKVEPGETFAAAAVRECHEEAGLHVAVIDQYPEQWQQYDHDRVHLHFFRCRPVDPSQPPRAPYRWVPRQALADYEFPAGNRALLAQLLADR